MRMGALRGGSAGAEELAASERWLRDEGVVSPERWAFMVAPARSP